MNNQIETLKRRFDARTGRTVVEKRECQSRPSPVQQYQQRQSQPTRPNLATMRSVGERRVVQGGEDNATTTTSAGTMSYSAGQRVRHARFGLGSIVAVEMLATDVKITVEFADAEYGRKTLLGKYAKLEVV